MLNIAYLQPSNSSESVRAEAVLEAVDWAPKCIAGKIAYGIATKISELDSDSFETPPAPSERTQ